MRKMSENVNILIEKMNQESLRSKPKSVNKSHAYEDSQSAANSSVTILKPKSKNRGQSGATKVTGQGSERSRSNS